MTDPVHPTRRRLMGGIAAACGMALLPARLAAETTVRGQEALAAALVAATPGTVLRLEPGDYGSLALQGGGGTPGTPVTLVAADPDRPPRFSGMTLREVGPMVLERLVFDYTFAPGDVVWGMPFTIQNGTDIALRNCLFDGDRARGVSAVDDGFGFAVGLSVRFMRGITLEGCEFRTFYRGLMIGQSDDVTVRRNDLHGLRMDGMNLAQVRRVLIGGNHIHDFDRSLDSEDHADMIQFWTAGTDKPSTDITIRGNLLNSGQGWYTQSIFMRNEVVDMGEAGRGMFYRNITIEENVIANAHLHGITAGETDGLVIRNNTLLRNPRAVAARHGDPASQVWLPAINVAPASRDVTIADNITAWVAGFDGQRDWQVTDNLVVQDRTRMEPGFYDKIFVGSPDDIARLRYRRGGPADGTGVGAASLRPD